MSAECFVASSRASRGTVEPGQVHSQAITYLRCSVTDCARNAFNDVNSGIENTTIEQCRIVDVGGCAWEGASRFVRFVGNYVRNAGAVAIGNLGPGNRDPSYPDLGSGQHVVAENIFEAGSSYAGKRGSTAAVQVSRGASQVIVHHNTFVNYNSSGITVNGGNVSGEYPAHNVIITANSIDLSCVGEEPVGRIGIQVGESDVSVSDNQIYLRGEADPKATGIRLQEPASNILVHDNLIRNCGVGIISVRGRSRVGEVLDARSFTRSDAPPRDLPLDRSRASQYKGWELLWENGKKPQESSLIESFDPETLRIVLREPHEMKADDFFTLKVPALNWNIHHNLITGCSRPVVLDSPGSASSSFCDNFIERGVVEKVDKAIVVQGNFQVEKNRIVGFEE